MTASTIPQLEDDLRALFRAQAEALDPGGAPPFPRDAGAPTLRRDARAAGLEPPEARHRWPRAGAAHPIAVVSVAAAVVAVVLATLLTGRHDAGLVTDDLIGTDPPTAPAPEATDGTGDDPDAPDQAGDEPVDGPVRSLQAFDARLRKVFGSAQSTDIVGSVVLGGAAESNRGPGGERTYLASLRASDGSALGVVLGDAVLRGDETRTDRTDPTGGAPVEVPDGVDDVALADLGGKRQVTVEAGGQFVTVRMEAEEPTVAIPTTRELLPIAEALLLGPGPAGFEDGVPDRSIDNPGALDPMAHLAFLDDAAFERELARVPADQRLAMRALREQYRAGRIQVAGPDGRTGWIPIDEFHDPPAETIDDLVRVRAPDGSLVMYWSRDVGGIPREAVETDPPPTMAQLRAAFGPRLRCTPAEATPAPSPAGGPGPPCPASPP